MRKAAHYIRQIIHRLGSGTETGIELESLQMACVELTSHSWCWLSERSVTLPRVVGQDWIALPASAARVERVRLNGYSFAEYVDQPTLKEHGPFYSAAYGLGYREIGGELVRTLELGGPAENTEPVTVYFGSKVVKPLRSEDPVVVPDFLDLALEELACAIAEGRAFHESGSVAQRTQAVWDGKTMDRAMTQDGVLGYEASAQTGQSFTDAVSTNRGARFRPNKFNN